MALKRRVFFSLNSSAHKSVNGDAEPVFSAIVSSIYVPYKAFDIITEAAIMETVTDQEVRVEHCRALT